MIKVTAEEISRCYDFAYYAWKQQSQSKKNFGTEPRDENQFIADQVTGKISEIIFKKYMESNYPNIEVEVNFEHYLNPLTTDNGDVKIFENGRELSLKIDIKGSSHNAQWMLIEEYKYMDIITGQKAADSYVMVRLGRDMPTNPELRKDPTQILDLEEVSGQVVGWITHEKLACPFDNEPWFIFKHGDRLVNPRLIPNKVQTIQSRSHLDNYINKVNRENPNYGLLIGPFLQAKINIGVPIKWLNLNIRLC